MHFGYCFERARLSTKFILRIRSLGFRNLNFEIFVATYTVIIQARKTASFKSSTGFWKINNTSTPIYSYKNISIKL